jgi:hypothetical protein
MNRVGGKTVAVMALAVGLAGVLTLSGTRMAASQGTVLTAAKTDRVVPVTEPWSSFWNRVPKVSIPLSAQQVTPPMGGHRWTLEARAVQDGERLYIELEWADPTPNRSVAAPQLFTDAAAIEFPSVAATSVPALCMGDPNATVNIWQWKAAWQADVHRGFQGDVRHRYPNADVDGYPFHEDPAFSPGRYVDNPFSATDRTSPVDNLVAGGFGTLTADPAPVVQGWGAWRDGTWRVVFSRPLAVGREGNVELGPDDWTDVAFAVWDGAADERDGMKSVSSFVALDVSPKPMPWGPGFPYWPAPFFVFLALWAGFAWMVIGHLPGKGRT